MVGVQARMHGGQVVVALRGDLDVTCGAEAAAAVAASAAPGQRVIIDLGGLDFMDCSALHALDAVRRRARRDGGDVLLAAPRGLVVRLLALTGLDGVFGVYPTVAAAFAAGLQPGEQPAKAPRSVGSLLPAGGRAGCRDMFGVPASHILRS